MSKEGRAQSRAQRRLAEVRHRQRAEQRRRRLLIAGPAAVILAAVIVLVVVLSAGTTHPASPSSGPGALLAGPGSTAQGGVVDGIGCNTSEQTVYHIHAHLTIIVDGTQRAIPAGVGIPGGQPVAQPSGGPFVGSGRCLYWLHTHDQSGVIHIESPVQKFYTLGDFFDIWRQPLTEDQAGPATGRLTAYVNGHRYAGDPRAIVLHPHAVIQLDIGRNVPPRPYTFAPGL